MEFKSEISHKFLVAIIFFFVGVSLITIIKNSSKEAIIVVTSIHIFTLLFICYIFYSIKYFITDNYLKIACGILYKKQIDINSIKSISKTSNLLSSPAASLTKRIELKFSLLVVHFG